MSTLRVIVAEDDVLLREGLQVLLDRFGHECVAALADALGIEERVAEHDPDVVLMDVRMPPTFSDEGIQAAHALRRRDPARPVLLLSQYVEQTYASELLEAGTGGIGYLLKDRVGQVADFVSALEDVASGGTVLDPEVVRQLLRRPPDPVARLTVREQEVLALMGEGRSNLAIARTLVVSEAMVSKHIGSILTKLDLPPSEDDHRRVLAVLAFLRGRGGSVPYS